jgi:hypothetical protein
MNAAADSAFNLPEDAKMATAIAKSKLAPRFGTEAGERFTVTRRPGSAKPEF